MKISVVSPVYKAEACIDELCSRLVRELELITSRYEIILVNDCSPDNSWEKICELRRKNKNIKGINFSRNFGQHYAITAGLDYSSGEYVVVMDCDLQDPPEAIGELYKKLQTGFDVVFAKREKRKDPFFKKLGSRMFHALYNYFTGSTFDSSVANFSISRRKVIDNLLCLREHSRSFQMFVRWTGFRIGFVGVKHSKRYAGRTSYTFSKLVSLAIDSIISQSNKPLRLSVKMGLILSLLSILAAIVLVVLRLTAEITVEGWASIVISIFFMSGLILANLGIIGIYLGKVYDETKGRPLYIVSGLAGLKSKDKS